MMSASNETSLSMRCTDGKRTTVMKTGYHRVEGNAACLLNLMKKRKPISSENAMIWATFVASLFGRTRKVREQVSEAMASRLQEHVNNLDFIREYQYWLLQRGELHYAKDIACSFEKSCGEMCVSQSFFHVSGLPTRTHIIGESLLTRYWHTIEAPHGSYFLISDCPVVTYEVRNGRPFPGTGFGNENTVALLPISPRQLWVACPKQMEWRSELTPDGVNSVNRLIVQFADRNVYANVESQEIQQLVDSEINTVVFGKNAYVPPARSATDIPQ